MTLLTALHPYLTRFYYGNFFSIYKVCKKYIGNLHFEVIHFHVFLFCSNLNTGCLTEDLILSLVAYDAPACFGCESCLLPFTLIDNTAVYAASTAACAIAPLLLLCQSFFSALLFYCPFYCWLLPFASDTMMTYLSYMK